MRILLAPDKFKGCLTAREVAGALAEGLRAAAPGLEIEYCPIADGGEGTVDAAVAAGFRRLAVSVAGPTGELVRAEYAERDRTAVVELAEASGLRRLPWGCPAPLTASSAGTGQLIATAVDAGAQTIVLGIGGSACTDGGAGLVGALGARLLDASGSPLPPGGAALAKLHRLDLSDLHPAFDRAWGTSEDRPVRLMVACDVTNPLLGRTGAATIYGPQKGANGGDIVALEAGLTRWADEVERVTGRYERNRAGAGAAGGVGFGARAMLGATMSSGIELLLELLGFHARLRHADLVVTGEGSLDAQTLHGKGPAGVAAAAARAGVPTVAVAGQISLGPEALAGVGLARAYALSDLEPDLGRCVSEARHLLVTIGRRLVSDWPRLRDERLEPVRLGRAGVRSSERTRIPLRLE